MTGVWLRRVAVTLVVVIGLFAVYTARVVSRGTAALARSDAAFDRGDLEAAVLEARIAALAYVPGAPHVAAAYGRLAAIARGAEAEGRYTLSRTAWGAVERAGLETEHWFDTHADARKEAQAGLARLDALAARQGTFAAPGEAPFARSPRVRGSSTPALGLLALAFALLLGGFGWCALRGVTPEGAARRRDLLVGLSIALGGAACWVLALIWR